MSALYGLIRRDGRPAGEAALSAMDRALAAMGPDSSGQWHDGSTGLGYRLMRFTTEDRFERQPVIGGDGNLILVATGRVDERSRLLDVLGITAREAEEMPDSLLLMRAYEAWGTGTPERLTGSFSFVVWDRREQRLFAARAAFGSAPLLYHMSDRIFAFSTRPKGLFALSEIPRAINEAYLTDYMVSIPGDPGDCMWLGVRMLEAGQALTFDTNGLRLWDHWRLDALVEQRFASNDECAEAMTALLDRVVADHARTATRTGVLMSGGLDSTAVAATLAVQRKPDEIPTFTEVPMEGWDGSDYDAGRYSDEGPFARAMALRHDNLRINLIRRQGFYLDGITDFFEAAEFPFRNASNRMWWEGCLAAGAAQGAKVMLTGVGGNATISCGGELLLAHLVADGDLRGAIAAARAQVRTGYRTSIARGIAGAVLAQFPNAIRGAVDRMRTNRASFTGPRPWEFYSPISRELADGTRLEERTRAKGWSLDRIRTPPIRENRLTSLRQPDRAGAENSAGHKQLYGVETRHPLCDRRLVEFCMSLPEAAFVPDGVPRGLLRQAMEDRVPAMILGNRKRGLQGSGWLDRLNENRAAIEAEIACIERSPLASHAIDVQRLRALARDLPPPGSESKSVKRAYRAVYEGGLMTGRFLRWVETSE